MMRIAILLVLCACGGPQVSEKRQPAQSVEPAKTGPAGPMGCVEDDAAKKACSSHGDAWQYSYPAPRSCSGVDRGPEPPAPPPACECIEKTEYQRLVKECSEVP